MVLQLRLYTNSWKHGLQNKSVYMKRTHAMQSKRGFSYEMGTRYRVGLANHKSILRRDNNRKIIWSFSWKTNILLMPKDNVLHRWYRACWKCEISRGQPKTVVSTAISYYFCIIITSGLIADDVEHRWASSLEYSTHNKFALDNWVMIGLFANRFQNNGCLYWHSS